MIKINELDVVRLTDSRKGTVVHIYPGGKAFCVEIADNDGQTLELVDAEEKDIAAVIWRAKEYNSF